MKLDHEKTVDLMLALNRDVVWLERNLRLIAHATSANADRLRQLAADALEGSKRRRKRTMSI